MLNQVLAVTRLNLANLRSRSFGSAIVVIGIAGVVAVLLGLLAMSNGFRSALAEMAEPDRALILRNGSNNEMDGWLTPDEVAILEGVEGLQTVSGELYVAISSRTRSDYTAVDVVGRGVTDAAFALRPELHVVAGRRFEPGKGEILVGIRAAQQYEGLELGDEVEARGTRWTVVGHFAAGGSGTESEIWMDLPIAQSTFRRNGVSVVRTRFPPAITAAIAARLEADPRLPLTLVPESQFFAAQSASRGALIDTFAWLVAGIMALGATVAALNTMYTAVSRRTIEIAILRALGFDRIGIVVSVLAEAMLLALAGGILGAAFVYLVFDGYATSTFNGASGAQVAFAFRLSPQLVGTGLGWALALGAVGGLLPALSAARMPVTRALRGS
jgi:putative ABC transport system permease protein